MNIKHKSYTVQSNKTFKRSILAAAVMAAGSGAFAQTDNEIVEEEVFVTGARANIADAAELKREAGTHVDAISAKDIGSLPDASVLEAIQRIPGISIERFAASDDPDRFSVEGSGLNLRGLPQTRSEFNGRDSFSASSGRGLTFQDVSPELMGSVEVIKNQTADMIEGGISGTVRLNTRKPLDTESPTAVVTYTSNYSDHRHDSVSDSTPAFSGLLSNVWDLSGGGKIGALASFASTDLEFRTDGYEAGLWVERDVTIDGTDTTRWVPRSAGIRTSDIDRGREAGSFVLQYENAAATFDTTLEYFVSDSSVGTRETILAQDEDVLIQGDDAVYDDTRFLRGTLTGTGDTRPQSRRSLSESKVEDLSLNFNWRATEKLSMSLDLQHIVADTEVTDLTAFGSVRADAYLDFTGGLGQVQYRAPGVDPSDLAAQNAYFSDPSEYFHIAAMDHLEDSEGESDAVRFDVMYDFENEYLDSVQTGVRFAERDQTTRWSRYNWAVLSEHWAGPEGRVFFDGRSEPAPWSGDPDGFVEGTPTPYTGQPNDFFRGRVDSGVAGGAWLAPSRDFVEDYDSYLATTGVFPGTLASLGTRTTDPAGNSVDLVNDIYLPSEVNPLTEENEAFYVRFNFSDQSDKLIGNFGLRYVSQTVATSGGTSFGLPQQVLPDVVAANNDLSAFGYTDAQIADFNLITTEDLTFLSGSLQAGENQTEFSEVLPSLNLRYELQDDMYIRFGASRSVAFPDTGLLRFSTFVEAKEVETIREDPNDTEDATDPIAYTFDRISGDGGNPFLKPMQATNIDVSWEWYFQEGNSVAAGIFYKDVENFFATSARNIPLTNNGVSNIIDILSPVNSGDGIISGFEFAYNKFWANGFGMQFNYTYLNEDGVPTQNTRAVEVDREGNTAPPFDDLPLQSLSEHTSNLALIYETGGWRTRLAYNYRSDYLLTQKQVNLDVPVFSQSIGLLDGSVFYSFTDNFEVGLTVNNIFDDVTNTDVQVNQAGLRLPRSSFLNDRRFGLVFKANL